MSFESLRRILPQAIRSAGIAKQVNAARVIEEAEEMIKQLWGDEKARYVEIVSFSEGVIKMKALAPVALQELRIGEIRLQNELNRRLGSRVVTSVRLVDR